MSRRWSLDWRRPIPRRSDAFLGCPSRAHRGDPALNALRRIALALLLLVVCLPGFVIVGSAARPVEGVLAVQVGGTAPAVAAETPFPFAHDARVAQMIAGVRQSDLYDRVAGLSGRMPISVGGASVTLTTRNAYNGTMTAKATQYAYEFMQAQGLSVSYQPWADAEQELSGRNVIAELVGATRPDEIVVICAHLDDMPEGGSAPGADDDASGCAACDGGREPRRPGCALRAPCA